ncbi:MAG: hypothetical protein SVQ76_00930 [Candidatus Nanohaloarchaea archaeon]|nr:hypothetical protein [Candidatus Nanohaloarchaea archaeon]
METLDDFFRFLKEYNVLALALAVIIGTRGFLVEISARTDTAMRDL